MVNVFLVMQGGSKSVFLMIYFLNMKLIIFQGKLELLLLVSLVMNLNGLLVDTEQENQGWIIRETIIYTHIIKVI